MLIAIAAVAATSAAAAATAIIPKTPAMRVSPNAADNAWLSANPNFAAFSAAGSGTSLSTDTRFQTVSVVTEAGFTPARQEVASQALWIVTVPHLQPNVEVTWSGLPDGFTPLKTISGADGTVRLTLPDGIYDFTSTAGGTTIRWTAHVDGANTVAYPYNLTGISVNSVDLAFLAGNGWSYSPDDRMATLSGAGPFRVTGSSTSIGISVSASCYVMVSNLTLRLSGVSGKSPFRVINGASVGLVLAGANIFVGGNEAAGLHVGLGQRITIEGDGSLEATGGDTAAGIGGSARKDVGAISIAGGTIRATGGYNGAGIGGALRDGGTIYISGGTIFAQGGGYGAGIGGGSAGAGTITISGGVIKSAKGGPFGAGIGVGGNTGGGTITITGGVIESAQGGTYAAGIGNGQGRVYDCRTTITISGGVIKNAQGGSEAAGIGGGECGSMASVTISGGTVVPVAGSGSPCAIGCAATGNSLSTSMGTVTVTGGSIITETSAFRPAAENSSNVAVLPLDILGFEPDEAVEMRGLTTLTAVYGKKDIHADSQGRIRLWLPPDEHCFNLNDKHCAADMRKGGDPVISVGTGVGVAVNGVDISAGAGAGWTYSNLVLTVTPQYPRARYAVSGFSDNGFVRMVADASGTVVLSNLTVRTRRLARIPLDIAQGVSLELVLKGTNTFESPYNAPCIHCPSGRTVTISGDGLLTADARAGWGCAAIGGASSEDGETRIENGGNITIAGGTVIALGGSQGAGIGGGLKGSGGTIRISRGTVTASSLYTGAGIGGGASGAGGNIFISGGTVTAKAEDDNGAGIGGGGAYQNGLGGSGGDGGTIDISGGTVSATGAHFGAGIGGGGGEDGGDGGTIAISGGEVTAVGGSYSVGIGGGGYNAESGTITISGGHITARGVHNEPGIGGGNLSEYGSVSIMGGTIFLDDVPTSIGNGRLAGESGQNFSTTITGGAIYTTLGAIKPYASNGEGSWVYPVDFPIGRALTKIESASFPSWPAYGTTDLMTDANGNLRVWMPPSGSSQQIIATIRPKGGPTLYFGYNVDSSGGATIKESVLFVNGTGVIGGQSQTGTGWRYNGESGTLTLLDNRSYTIAGTSLEGDFQIFAAASPSVTISDLVLRTNAKNASAFVISNACTLTLASVNGLGALGQYAAGIQVCSNATLTIKGTGALAAQGGKGAAGIGSSGGYTPPGKIVIEAGTITATGGERGAGIGGGQSANLTTNNIVITGGDITATGGKNAAGIGAGYGTQAIPSGAVRISGGTILATKGSSASTSNVGDFIASGNVVSATGERSDTSCVITGGSVHGTNLSAKPTPVDATGTPLRYLLVTGLTAGEAVQIESDDIPADYGMNDVVADDTGSICLWLPVTNIERVVTVNGAYFAVNSSVNKAIDATSGSDLPPDKLRRNGSDFWRVTLPYFKPGATIMLAGLEPHATSAKVETDGHAYVFLPDGEYAFTVGDRPWAVSVSRAPAVAHRVTGVFVGGEEVGTLLGDGWTYDFTNGVLTLDGENTDFVLSGTNTEGQVRVSALAAASVTLSNLSLVTCSDSPTLALNPDTTLRIFLDGTNTISSTNWVWRSSAPAIFVPAGATLRIDIATNSPCGSLASRGGYGCAAIGGQYMGQTNTGTIIVEGGEINAVGGFHGAAIGGGWQGAGGTIEISGGNVTATSGDYPNISNDNSSAIGGGFGQAGTAPAYTQSGGTVVAYGSRNDIGGYAVRAGSSVLITGGSLHLAGRGIANPEPSNAVERVLCVTITNLPPNAPVEDLKIESASKLVDYGDSDLVADGEGRLYLWLPDDNPYDFTRANGEEWHVEVAGTNVVATYGPLFTLESLNIESIEVTDNAIRLVVSAVPEEWLVKNAKSLRVRASAILPLPAGDDALLPSVNVTAELNQDGTVTLTIPRPADGSQFYRVEGE